jgi:hypothetical protein
VVSVFVMPFVDSRSRRIASKITLFTHPTFLCTMAGVARREEERNVHMSQVGAGASREDTP